MQVSIVAIDQRLYSRASCEYNTKKGESATSTVKISATPFSRKTLRANQKAHGMTRIPKSTDKLRNDVTDGPKIRIHSCVRR